MNCFRVDGSFVLSVVVVCFEGSLSISVVDISDAVSELESSVSVSLSECWSECLSTSGDYSEES